jgi:hypothetical protein
MFGFTTWLSPPTHIRGPTAGSLNPVDVLSTSAFYDQVHHIGWYNFCLGRINTLWVKPVTATIAHHKRAESEHWASLCIDASWTFITAMWHYRNTAVHGDTVEVQA